MILLAGLRASGKSLCGRAMKHLLLDLGHCDYLDLDEGGKSGPSKFEFFYERCLQRMVAEGGIWILDKLGPYGDEARMSFLKEIQTRAVRSILLQFVHGVELDKLRSCYFRFHRKELSKKCNGGRFLCKGDDAPALQECIHLLGVLDSTLEDADSDVDILVCAVEEVASDESTNRKNGKI